MKGCGLGDIRSMLEMKNLRGKCADLNALFVGLARASGLPARDLYGIRVAPSNQSPSLVDAVRTRLFGSWEGNWIAFNDAHDITLPGSIGSHCRS